MLPFLLGLTQNRDWGSALDPTSLANSESITFMAGIKLLCLSCEGFISNSTETNTNIGWFGFFKFDLRWIWIFDFQMLQKSSENVTNSTKCFYSTVNYTKIASGWGGAPDPAGGAYSAPPDPLAVIGWERDFVTPPAFSQRPLSKIRD